MIGIVGNLMEMTLGDVCKVVVELHPEFKNAKQVRAVAEKVLDFCEKEKIPTEMVMGAIIFLMWNTGVKVEESINDLVKHIRQRAQGN